jgi:hypothetical protein
MNPSQKLRCLQRQNFLWEGFILGRVLPTCNVASGLKPSLDLIEVGTAEHHLLRVGTMLGIAFDANNDGADLSKPCGAKAESTPSMSALVSLCW